LIESADSWPRLKLSGLTSTGIILIAVIVFGTASQLRRFHDLKLECEERSVAKSHSNQYNWCTAVVIDTANFRGTRYGERFCG